MVIYANLPILSHPALTAELQPFSRSTIRTRTVYQELQEVSFLSGSAALQSEITVGDLEVWSGVKQTATGLDTGS